MPTLIPIVEGAGDMEAVPLLLRRILTARERWDWTVGQAKKAGGIGSFRKRAEEFLRYAARESGCGGILILLDLDDGCASDEAHTLAGLARSLDLAVPVAVVLACREYEAWFLASLPALAGHDDLPAGLVYSGPVEGPRGVKEWLTSQLPPGRAYKETIHQARFTARLDFDLARQHSRSFQRLWHAVDQVLEAAATGRRGEVSPWRG
jgi:hypothetical protein